MRTRTPGTTLFWAHAPGVGGHRAVFLLDGQQEGGGQERNGQDHHGAGPLLRESSGFVAAAPPDLQAGGSGAP
eukprot:2891243-Pyramimonas_sp.AAC.1